MPKFKKFEKKESKKQEMGEHEKPMPMKKGGKTKGGCK